MAAAHVSPRGRFPGDSPMAPLHHVYFLGTVIQAPAVWAAPNGTAVARWSLAVPTRGPGGHRPRGCLPYRGARVWTAGGPRRGRAPPRLHGPDRRARPMVADGAGQPIAPHPGGDRRAHPVSVLPPADPVCRHWRWRDPAWCAAGRWPVRRRGAARVRPWRVARWLGAAVSGRRRCPGRSCPGRPRPRGRA